MIRSPFFWGDDIWNGQYWTYISVLAIRFPLYRIPIYMSIASQLCDPTSRTLVLCEIASKQAVVRDGIHWTPTVNALLIGIDCATVDEKIGLALAEYCDGFVTLNSAVLCSREQSAARTVSEWLRNKRGPSLLAIDAPLGWPASLGRSLIQHSAGQRIETSPNEMFRRATDRFIQSQLSKTPLDVGADRIARTAHAALALLADIRNLLGIAIPLAWTRDCLGTAAIEVYPAATLVAHGFRSAGYKKPKQAAERKEILTSLRTLIDPGGCDELLMSNADILDAAVCVLAGKDFFDGRALPPKDLRLAAQEGWIWAPTWQQGVSHK